MSLSLSRILEYLIPSLLNWFSLASSTHDTHCNTKPRLMSFSNTFKLFALYLHVKQSIQNYIKKISSQPANYTIMTFFKINNM